MDYNIDRLWVPFWTDRPWWFVPASLLDLPIHGTITVLTL